MIMLKKYVPLRYNLCAGFTLIELLVVVLVVGILAAVALPQYETAVAKSRVSALLPLMRAMDTAEQIHYISTGAYTNKLADLAVQMPAGGQEVTQSQMDYAGFSCYLRAPEGDSASMYCGDDKSGVRIEKYFNKKNYYCWTKRGFPSPDDLSVKVCRAISGLSSGYPSAEGNGHYYPFL